MMPWNLLTTKSCIFLGPKRENFMPPFNFQIVSSMPCPFENSNSDVPVTSHPKPHTHWLPLLYKEFPTQHFPEIAKSTFTQVFAQTRGSLSPKSPQEAYYYTTFHSKTTQRTHQHQLDVHPPLPHPHSDPTSSPHPSPFSARYGFFGSKPFSKTNEFLKNAGLKEIDWSRKE